MLFIYSTIRIPGKYDILLVVNVSFVSHVSDFLTETAFCTGEFYFKHVQLATVKCSLPDG